MWDGTTLLITKEFWSIVEAELDETGQMFVKMLLF